MLLNKAISANDSLFKTFISTITDFNLNVILVTKKIVSKYKDKGLSVNHIIRTKRKGFKAGALKNGLKTASGEFIAIFDSDFLPNPDWLMKTIPYFQNNQALTFHQNLAILLISSCIVHPISVKNLRCNCNK